YQLGCALPLSPRCSCCGRAPPLRRIPRRSAVQARIAGRRYVQESPPPTVGMLAEPNWAPPIDFRLVNGTCYLPFVRPDDEAEQIVKSEGCATLQFSAYQTYPYGGCRGWKSCDRVGAG